MLGTAGKARLTMPIVGSSELGTPTVPKYVLAAVMDEERSFQRRDE